MSRASFLVPILLWLSVVPGPLFAQRRGEDIPFKSGNIEVLRRTEALDDEAGPIHLAYHQILRDQIVFGQCFEDGRFRRLPITYYHPQGPVGLALGKFNWFPGKVNTYHADARLPAALVGQGWGLASIPAAQLVALWSEPPIAVLGLNAGTPAAYARPLQHFHFYEPTREVIDLNQRKDKERFFHFIPEARARGAQIRIMAGAPRAQLREYGPRRFYHLMIVEACSGENGEKIFLDLFTREGIAQCLEHLADDGVLCVHTSHRFVNLPPVLSAIGRDLNLHVRRGHDLAPGKPHYGGGQVPLAEFGHWTSEWVVLARKEKVLNAVCKTPANYSELLKKNRDLFGFRPEEYWSTPEPLDHVWTDKGPNLLHGILRGHPLNMRYSAVAGPLAEFFSDVLPAIRLGSFESQRFIRELSFHMPRFVDDWLVALQLKYNPQVEKLWP